MLPLEGRSLAILVITSIFLGISFVTVCLRCFVRLHIVKTFGWDDALMVFAMFLNILFAVAGITGAYYGMGQKTENLIRTGTMETAMFWWWLGQTSYVWVCAVAKVSIAVALLRLTIARAHSIILWTVIGMTSLVGLVFFFILTLQCHPVSYFWQRVRVYYPPHHPMPGSCINIDSVIAVAWVYSIVATCCDLTLGLLPILLVWKLQMKTQTKAALAGILGMGSVASAAVIVRLPFLKDYKNPDFLYATAQISIWSNIEASLGITAGSLVTLRPLSRWFCDPSSAGHSRSKSKRTGKDISLQNVDENRFFPREPQFRRPDVHPDNCPVINTIGTPYQGCRTSSQEDLNPKQGQRPGTSFSGTNVQRSFFMS